MGGADVSQVIPRVYIVAGHMREGRHGCTITQDGSAGGGLRIEHTNSATSRALPLSDSLCTLEVSFSFLLGFSEVAIVVVRVGLERRLGSQIHA